MNKSGNDTALIFGVCLWVALVVMVIAWSEGAFAHDAVYNNDSHHRKHLEMHCVTSGGMLIYREKIYVHKGAGVKTVSGTRTYCMQRCVKYGQKYCMKPADN